MRQPVWIGVDAVLAGIRRAARRDSAAIRRLRPNCVQRCRRSGGTDRIELHRAPWLPMQWSNRLCGDGSRGPRAGSVKPAARSDRPSARTDRTCDTGPPTATPGRSNNRRGSPNRQRRSHRRGRVPFADWPSRGRGPGAPLVPPRPIPRGDLPAAAPETSRSRQYGGIANIRTACRFRRHRRVTDGTPAPACADRCVVERTSGPPTVRRRWPVRAAKGNVDEGPVEAHAGGKSPISMLAAQSRARLFNRRLARTKAGERRCSGRCAGDAARIDGNNDRQAFAKLFRCRNC